MFVFRSPCRAFKDLKPRRYPKRAKMAASDYSQKPGQPQFRHEFDWQVRGFKEKIVWYTRPLDCVNSGEASSFATPMPFEHVSNSRTRCVLHPFLVSHDSIFLA